MDLNQHYGGQTPYILMDGHTPIANGMPTNMIFLHKQLAKYIKSNGIVCDHYMNVIYDRPMGFVVGSTLVWELQGNLTNVQVLEEKKFFVKGKNVWAYCVGVLE